MIRDLATVVGRFTPARRRTRDTTETRIRTELDTVALQYRLDLLCLQVADLNRQADELIGDHT